MSGTFALISGGGTAGHVQPGLDIARALLDQGYGIEELHYVGSERGIETTLVPEAGLGLTVLPGRGIARKLTIANVGAVWGLLRAFVAAFRLVRERRPKVIVSLGGYASVPCALWGVLLRVPIVVAEQNAVPGLANRLVGRFAKASAVSFPNVDLPRAVWTGNPVRESIRAVDRDGGRAEARKHLDVPEHKRLVSVFGGSLGARRINSAVTAAVAHWADRDDLVVRHIVGQRDFAEVERANPIAEADPLDYRLIEYEHDMASVYAASDLVVCRSGATSVAELATTGTPAILVPLPGAPGDHQTANARALVECGGAELIADAELDGARFVRSVDALLDEPRLLAAMAAGAISIARPDAASAVADLVVAHATETS